jgi:hypothetical protein
MTVLTLTSTGNRPLQPLVEAAIRNELRLLQAGVRRTEEKLAAFEAQYSLSSPEFLRRYEADELAETLDLAEWVCEYRLLERLRDKVLTLQEIRFAN